MATHLAPKHRPCHTTITDILLLILLLALLLTGNNLAYGSTLPPNPSSGELRLHGPDGTVTSALLESTEINVHVEGIVARVEVEQVFHNRNSEWVEGEYLFPLANNGAVDYMEMSIGHRRIVGKIREKQEAKKIYEQAKLAGKKASLVSQQRPNLFTNKVANIAPGETIKVRLRYVDIVPFAQGRFQLRLPTTITPRYEPPSTGFRLAPDASDNESLGSPMTNSQSAVKLRLTATINAGLELDSVQSLYQGAQVLRQSDAYTLTLDPDAKLDRDVVLEWTPMPGSEPQTALFKQSINGEDFALLMVIPPSQYLASTVLPRETIFVIDTSGSMGGVAIQQAREALTFGLSQLGVNDRFNVIEFNSRPAALWADANAASDDNKQIAHDFVNALNAGGGTEMASALRMAFARSAPSGYVRQVVFITDGSVGNDAALFELIHRDRGSSRLFTVGIGSAPNSHFMEKAAAAGQGSFTYIGAQTEIQQRMSDLFRKLQFPIMTNIAVDFGGGDNVEMYPAQTPDLYAGEPLIVAAKLKSSNDDPITISGKRDVETFQRRLNLNRAASSPDISKVWARRKLSALYDVENQARFNGDTDMAELFKQEITNVALSHQLLSKYTSFVAVEDQVSRGFGDLLVKHLVPNAMPAGSTQPVAMPAGGLGIWQYWLVAVLSLLLAIILMKQPPAPLTQTQRL